jgi:signal transduction histidine kinase
MKRGRGYQGSYLIGFIIIAVVALRAILFYLGSPILPIAVALIAIYSLFYACEPWLSNRFRWSNLPYFLLQTALVIVLSNLRPFLDISSDLYMPLCIQAVRNFSRRGALILMIVYMVLLSATLTVGLGWADGLVLLLLFLAVGAFLISYDFLYARTQADQAESQRLLADLQAAHQRLQAYAAQAKDLAAARERNRLARELHDSVSQAIFSINLTSESARLLLDREPARVPEQIDRLQAMTEQALAQLRSLIAELRPPQSS